MIPMSRVMKYFKARSCFSFNIKGLALGTTPQGPYDIKAGGMTQIKFKNVFEDTHKFKIFVDHEDFYVKSALEQIKSKKVIVSTLSSNLFLLSNC